MNAERRRHPTVPRDRQLIGHVRFDDYAEGIIQCGMRRQPPDDASDDFMRGYREGERQTAISELLTGEAG